MRAERKQVPFSLTPEWAAARWTGRCELTGIPFVIARQFGGFFSPSFDRIEASKGYVEGNVRVILFAVNALKGRGTDADMMLVAKALIDNSPCGPR